MENKDIRKEIDEFFTSIGAMVEMWNVAYKNFKEAGYSSEEATRQTAALIQVILTQSRGNKNGNE